MYRKRQGLNVCQSELNLTQKWWVWILSEDLVSNKKRRSSSGTERLSKELVRSIKDWLNEEIFFTKEWIQWQMYCSKTCHQIVSAIVSDYAADVARTMCWSLDRIVIWKIRSRMMRAARSMKCRGEASSFLKDVSGKKNVWLTAD